MYAPSVAPNVSLWTHPVIPALIGPAISTLQPYVPPQLNSHTCLFTRTSAGGITRVWPGQDPAGPRREPDHYLWSLESSSTQVFHMRTCEFSPQSVSTLNTKGLYEQSSQCFYCQVFSDDNDAILGLMDTDRHWHVCVCHLIVNNKCHCFRMSWGSFSTTGP